MIQKTFLILEGIGTKKEKNLWREGINNWEDFLKTKKAKGIPQNKKGYYDRKIRQAKQNLYSSNSEYFYNLLPKNEHWRLYDFFKEEAIFLDIETNGLTDDAGLTVIGLSDGLETKTMIKGINLDFDLLKKELEKYKMIVTFNGSIFDIPFIKKRYGNILPNTPHFDLRFACSRIGLAGGLKEIEKKLGIKRSRVIEKIYGGDAVLLWRKWFATGDEYYLRLLVEYNEEDCINLRYIADYAYQKLKKNNL